MIGASERLRASAASTSSASPRQPAVKLSAIDLAKPVADDAALLTVLLALRPSLPHVWLRAGSDHGNVVALAAGTEPEAPATVFAAHAGLDPAAELAAFQRLPLPMDTT